MVTRDDITWEIMKTALPAINKIRGTITEEAYQADKKALQDFLCGYFNSDHGKDCNRKQGESQISPVGHITAKGGKCLKVRWGIPGQGKSGGVRLAVVAYCDDKHVKLAGAWLRRDEPGDGELAGAFEKA
jgi:hypothetical protein